jgi:hypothetical protein
MPPNATAACRDLTACPANLESGLCKSQHHAASLSRQPSYGNPGPSEDDGLSDIVLTYLTGAINGAC